MNAHLSLFLLALAAASSVEVQTTAVDEARARVLALETRVGELQVQTTAVDEARARVVALETRVGELQASRRGGGAGVGSISPGLEPVSDAKFFDGRRADYNTDKRPTTKDHFSFPFPEVQDSHDFDKDFVKDENGDDGEWKAQSYYDDIRSKIGGLRKAAELAKVKEVEEKMELEASQALEKQAAAEAARQKALADAAKEAEAEAQAKANVVEKSIDKAEDFVKSEVTDLEECKKQLAQAKRHLDKVMADQEAALEARALADEAAARSRETQNAEAVRAESGRAAEEKDDRSLEERIVAMEAKVQKTEADLKAATHNLRKFRKADDGKGQNGGVYRTTKSGGQMALPGALTVLALVGLLAAP